jgi:hypothetical protein
MAVIQNGRLTHPLYNKDHQAKVTVENRNRASVTLEAEDTDTMILPPGKWPILAKFTWNMPAGVVETDKRNSVTSYATE